MSKLMCAICLLVVVLAISCTEQQNDDAVAEVGTLQAIGGTLAASSTTTRIPPPPATPSPPATNTTSPTASASATQTPRPTPTATPSPLPSETPTALPTPAIILQMSSSSGDGRGIAYGHYFGAGMPYLILYADGRLLRGDQYQPRQVTYVESHMSEGEICALLDQIAQTGFLELPVEGYSEAIYEFDETTIFSEGAPGVEILVNGEQPKAILIYVPYLPYTITEVGAMYDLLDDLQPPGEPFRPAALMLWLEKGTGQGNYVEEQKVTPTPWPNELPQLQALYVSRTPVPYYTFGNSSLEPGGETVLRGAIAEQLWSYFGQQTNGGWFVEGGQLYFVVARLLLPHEQGVTSLPVQPYRFSLPFECVGD